MFSTRKWSTAYILCFLFGTFGLHRFYTGYIGIGFLQFLTGGGFGLWTLIDFLSLSFNNFKDEGDYDLENYNGVIATIGALLYFFWWVPFVLFYIARKVIF